MDNCNKCKIAKLVLNAQRNIEEARWLLITAEQELPPDCSFKEIIHRRRLALFADEIQSKGGDGKFFQFGDAIAAFVV